MSNHNMLREDKEVLIGIELTIFIMAFILYLNEYKPWLQGLKQFLAWILKPEIHYIPIPLDGVPYAIIGALQILLIGMLATHLLLPNEKDPCIRWLTAFGMGTGLIALLTIVLALLHSLFNFYLNITVIVLMLTLVVVEIKKQGKAWLRHFAEYWRPNHTIINKRHPILAIGIIITFLIFYHGALSPIDHFDALIYHAGIAKVMFKYHGIPLIAGPSPGIQLSGNYPPLYPSLGAFFFTHMGTTTTDLPLRLLSPFMGLLTLLTTYKLGYVLLGHRGGYLTSLILLITPYFIIYSIHAINNMTVTFFLALATLHIIMAYRRQQSVHLLTAGFLYGFALSTSYLALYFAPAFVLMFTLLSSINVKQLLRMIGPFLAGAISTGAFWYLRNLILLGNPIWPFAYQFIGGSFIDQGMQANAFHSIRSVGTYVSFGREPDILDWIHLIFFGRAGFPALSILTLLGGVYSIFIRPKDVKLSVLILTFVPVFFMSISGIFFPRYLVLVLPFASLLAAQILSHILTSTRKIVKFIAIFMLVTIIIYPGLTVAVAGKMYHDVTPWEPPRDFLWYFQNPGIDYLTAMIRGEGERVKVWTWLNEHLGENDRVATYEPRIYYIKEGGIHHFFFLDGWEAKPLFSTNNPESAIHYLRDNHVRYILLMEIVSVGIESLPLIKFLGSPYFPEIHRVGDARVYHVGPIPDFITLNSKIPARINDAGWTEIKLIAGHLARSVVEGIVLPRLFIATPNAVMVNITYLDEGIGGLMINLYHPYSKKWLHGLANIKKTNTGKWMSYTFVVPQDPSRFFVELGLYAYGSDFIISQINVSELNISGYLSIASLNPLVLNRTIPPSLMIPLPLMKGGERLIVNSNSFGRNISVEVFEGIIQPGEETKWWERHKMMARSPALPNFGTVNPTLLWEAKEGIYTLVIVLWGECEPDIKIDFSIAIGYGR